MTRKPWTAKDLQMLRDHFADTRTADLAEQLGRPYFAVAQRASLMGLRKSEAYLTSPTAQRLDGKRGMATRFQPGRELSGRAAQQVKPLGSYRVNADGYLDQKVSTEPGPQHRRWKPVHRIVWEQAHGPVPAGHAVCFKPGRHSTELEAITIDALELVTRRELMMRNTFRRYGPEVTKIVHLRGAITRAINKREKEDEA